MPCGNPTPGTRTTPAVVPGPFRHLRIAIANAGGIGSVTTLAPTQVLPSPDQLMLTTFGGWPTGGGQTNNAGYKPLLLVFCGTSAAANAAMMVCPPSSVTRMDPVGSTTSVPLTIAGWRHWRSDSSTGVARQANTSVGSPHTATAMQAATPVVLCDQQWCRVPASPETQFILGPPTPLLPTRTRVVVVDRHGRKASPMNFWNRRQHLNDVLLGAGKEGSDGTKLTLTRPCALVSY